MIECDVGTDSSIYMNILTNLYVLLNIKLIEHKVHHEDSSSINETKELPENLQKAEYMFEDESFSAKS
jgi:hypothetical protein